MLENYPEEENYEFKVDLAEMLTGGVIVAVKKC